MMRFRIICFLEAGWWRSQQKNFPVMTTFSDIAK